MTIDEQIAILQAIKEGKKVEAIRRATEPGIQRDWAEWQGSPNFFAFNYRIVRKPRRWIIFRWKGQQYAEPYNEHIPDDARIICTAVEELPPSPEVVDKFIEDTNNELAKRP